MPVYMNSGKIVADGTGRVDGDSKVLQEVLADLKTAFNGSSGVHKKYSTWQARLAGFIDFVSWNILNHCVYVEDQRCLDIFCLNLLR